MTEPVVEAISAPSSGPSLRRREPRTSLIAAAPAAGTPGRS
jgi:hypothetical protein